MSRCRKLSTLALTGCLLISAVARLQAQSDSDVALKNAREALQAEQFERTHVAW